MKRKIIIFMLFMLFFLEVISIFTFANQNNIRGESMTKYTKDFIKPSKKELKEILTPIQFDVTQRDKTEPPFYNIYDNFYEEGIYVDVVSREPLFSSIDKYDSKTGWPSFTKPLVPDNIVLKRDFKLIFPRTEVRSKYADSHLGHVFNDGPPPTGKRYCMNSAALKFIPKDQMKELGYGEFLKIFNK